MIQEKNKAVHTPKLTLSQKTEIFALIHEGRTNIDIAKRFGVTGPTVAYYRKMVRTGNPIRVTELRPGSRIPPPPRQPKQRPPPRPPVRRASPTKPPRRTTTRRGVTPAYSGPTVYERGRIMVRAGKGEDLKALATEFNVTLRFAERLVRTARMQTPVLPY